MLEEHPDGSGFEDRPLTPDLRGAALEGNSKDIGRKTRGQMTDDGGRKARGQMADDSETQRADDGKTEDRFGVRSSEWGFRIKESEEESTAPRWNRMRHSIGQA